MMSAMRQESWMWSAFLRLAEPLIEKIDRVIEEPECDRLLAFAPEPVSHSRFEEDAERWDGMA